MKDNLAPYGSPANTRLIAKFGHDKTPERQVGGRRILRIERLSMLPVS